MIEQGFSTHDNTTKMEKMTSLVAPVVSMSVERVQNAMHEMMTAIRPPTIQEAFVNAQINSSFGLCSLTYGKPHHSQAVSIVNSMAYD